jgi:hypothetical protein
MPSLAGSAANLFQLCAGYPRPWASARACHFRPRPADPGSDGHPARRHDCPSSSSRSVRRWRNFAARRALDASCRGVHRSHCCCVLAPPSWGLVALDSPRDCQYHAGTAGTGGLVARCETLRLEADRYSETLSSRQAECYGSPKGSAVHPAPPGARAPRECGLEPRRGMPLEARCLNNRPASK